MSIPEFKIVPYYEVVHMLVLWKTKGFDPAAAFRFFGAVGKGQKGVFAGVEDYSTSEVLFSEGMRGFYGTYAELYAALGALLDDVYTLWGGTTSNGASSSSSNVWR